MRLCLLLPVVLGLSLPAAEVGPLDLTFHRLAVRRAVFTGNIPLARLVPTEVVALPSMHPAFLPASEPGQPRPDLGPGTSLAGGNLVMTGPAQGQTVTTRYLGGINPFATYDLNIAAVEIGTSGQPVEVGVDLATLGLGSRVQVVARYGGSGPGVVLRLVREGTIIREQVFIAGAAPKPPYRLVVQLSGISLAAFATDAQGTTYLGHTIPGEDFRRFLDFRDRKVAASATANVATVVPAGASVAIAGYDEYLSPGVGQADIRLITRKDGTPYQDDSRLWFTFSCRGLNIEDSAQGILSLDPTVFDPRFEGMIVYDHGDGLLRNDYSSNLFYDDDAKEWRAMACDFGGSKGVEGRSGSGLLTARTTRDPRRGFTVLTGAKMLTGIPGKHEDPCLQYDAEIKRWRLLTCDFDGFHTRLLESEHWDGPFTSIAGPTAEDSTGVLIQRIGGKRYAFSGSNVGKTRGPILVYSYPDLKPLGNLKIDLPAHWPEQSGRIWPNIIPLPPGGPYRYLALMMDRPNFPGVRGKTWSYGALYLFGAWTEDIGDARYEFAPAGK